MSSETSNPLPAPPGQQTGDAPGSALAASATGVTAAHRAADTSGAGTGTGNSAMPAAKRPRSTRGIAALGTLLAIVLAAVGVLAVRDALFYGGILGGTPLIHELAKVLEGLRPSPWTVVVGVLLALLGLALLITALRPFAPKVAVLDAATGVFLRPRDVTRLVETAVENVDGVLGVRASATPRRVTVDIRSTGDEGVEGRVREAVAQRLAPLRDQPTVRVRAQGARR